MARADSRMVLQSGRPGAALLEGWSDDGAAWQFLLPWPEETRTLPWSDAAEWKAFVQALERDCPEDTDPRLPFAGGWVGFISYEASAAEEDVRPRDLTPPEPAAFFAKHASGIAIDPNGNAFAFGREGALDRIDAAPSFVPHGGTLRDSLGNGAHARLVEQIREAIRDGEVYQVNLTRAFETDAVVGADELYRALTAPHAPQSSAFLRGDGWTIVSASPEVLLRFDRRSGVATSLPIKGTVRRDGNDDAEIATLLASAKDDAEHLMIVDVVRNDFGKIARTVSVPEYRVIRTLDYAHHLESTVRADGLQDASVADVLAALSPAASITGAPKRAAVNLIREIEPVPRGVYCGSIGFITARGARMSVAIRTAVVTESSMRYHAGGGIVWDSDAAAEDEECRVKAAPFFRFVGGAPSTSP